MKIAITFIAALIAVVSGYAQDTIQGQVIRVDTVKIQQVRVDTVYVQQQPAPQQAKQKPQKPPQKINMNKIYYGGYVNLSFGKYTVIGAEPMIGYKLTPKLSVGGKFSYEYIKDKRYHDEYETSNYGISVFSRLRITQGLYAHAEYSTMNYRLYYDDGSNSRKWVPFLLLGGGLSQPVTKNTWFNAEVLFDVLQSKNSPYKPWEPFFSVGFGVGF